MTVFPDTDPTSHVAGQGSYHTKGGRQTDTNCLLIEQQTSSTSGAKHIFTKIADHVTMYGVCTYQYYG